MQVGDRIRCTVPPWKGEKGIIEHIDGGYIDIRLDSSECKEDIHELYPSEFIVIKKEFYYDVR